MEPNHLFINPTNFEIEGTGQVALVRPGVLFNTGTSDIFAMVRR
jgi:hypothetical protein